jgi:hypothetical protein
MSRLIALLTDYGYADTYVAQVKAVLLRMCPTCEVLDLTHGVPPQNVRSGAYLLASATPYLPRRRDCDCGGRPRCGHSAARGSCAGAAPHLPCARQRVAEPRAARRPAPARCGAGQPTLPPARSERDPSMGATCSPRARRIWRTASRWSNWAQPSRPTRCNACPILSQSSPLTPCAAARCTPTTSGMWYSTCATGRFGHGGATGQPLCRCDWRTRVARRWSCHWYALSARSVGANPWRTGAATAIWRSPSTAVRQRSSSKSPMTPC